MKIFSWTELSTETQKNIPFFSNGTGISIGSFDGIHLGHQKLLKTLVEHCTNQKLLCGVFTFSRPLPSIKHSDDYKGDITTLSQRLEIFEKFGLDFVIVADFNESFASHSGIEFLDTLIKLCNLKFLAEGIDFRCGFKGATDTQAIRYWAEQNKISTIFVDPVFYREGTDEEERISSSYIRGMILKGFFTTVTELLAHPFELDFSSFYEDFNTTNENLSSNTELIITKNKIIQVIPSESVYHCKNENNEDVRVQITPSQIILDKQATKILF